MLKTRNIIILFFTLFTQGFAFNRTRSGAYNDPVCQSGRQIIVHLFEWKWKDIAKECEEYLGPKGFCGVQVSPPNEHIQGSPWWTRYQPVSYKLESRSGSRDDFIDMVNRCSAVGVNIVVDGVINHMSGLDSQGTGTGGSSYDGSGQNYPGVPFSNQDFNQPICTISNYNNANEVRNCYLVGLNDLAGAKDYVRTKIAEYLQDCVDIGVKGFRIDAAKHMWPGDIKETIDKVGNLPEGGRPFFFHEVIDQGGEVIKVQEYYGVGRTTEFRYGIKVAEAISNTNFAALGGVYDQGWGMSDYDHAAVFIDNHDNQRGHGGGGSLLTHKDPYKYKLGSAFMLAHDYGFKRLMSSYYFSSSDQGPPSSSPGCGGSEWVCEHRWKSIGNMVEFSNVAAGQPIKNWDAGSDYVGFARGAVAFFAMGNLNKDFNTGLPDGSYCDIISECAQTVQVSGGKANLKPHDGQEPVVAICVGCGETTTTTKPSTTEKPGTTTAKTTTPGTGTTASTTTESVTTDSGVCCDIIMLSSSGGVLENYPELLGKYIKIGEENGRPLYKHSTILQTEMHLHYTIDSQYKWEGWMITEENDEHFGYISNENDADCPTKMKSGWEFMHPEGWIEDSTLSISCSGDQPTPSGPTDGTTSGPTTGTPKPTDGPGPGGIATTIVAIKKQTVIGSDVFIIGGVAPDQQIDISLHTFPVIWDKYQFWMDGDDHLDWDGAEPGQGAAPNPENPNEEWEAMGTPGAWTTNDETNTHYYAPNTFGEHYWFVVMEMDCSQTQNGWFEFNTIYTLGGETGEPAVDQEECTGGIGGTAPFTSTNHIARCGYMNVFTYGVGDCLIEEVPDLPAF